MYIEILNQRIAAGELSWLKAFLNLIRHGVRPLFALTALKRG